MQVLYNDVKKNHKNGDVLMYCKRELDKILKMADPKMSYGLMK